ncbi:MMPL family transporter [Hymenobacter humi]|uniref:MMPL family transporter n=1 Tax=Hymenobacter humi TaxID=1411620 RepID=A0ABW2U3N1_9BACT
MVVTGLTLLVFFRTWSAVVFPLIVVGVTVIWCIGSIVLLGFKINLLTGLIPSIIVVIGIPNCTYLLSRYHYDYRKSGNQMLAMTRVIRKIGLVTLMNNTTTAVGFIVFAFTDIAILYQFGLVATINIFAAFVISFILIPAVFSMLPPPTPKQARAPRCQAAHQAAGVFRLPRARPPAHRVCGGPGDGSRRGVRHFAHRIRLLHGR